jgi:cytochrome c-type biogenesis protein CcmE
MVRDGSVARQPNGLDVTFVLTDHAGSDFSVRYSGILPDLFREGQGVLVQGKLGTDGVFLADQVLAKHDENYMPPELVGMQQGKGS